MTIGGWIHRLRWPLLGFWLAVTAGMMLLVRADGQDAGLTTDLLPPDAPFNVAREELARHFQERSGLSEAAIVFERPDGPLTPHDLDEIEYAGAQVAKPGAGGPSQDQEEIIVRTPRLLALLGDKNPLRSADGRAALVVVSLPYNDASTQAVRTVNRLHAQLDSCRPRWQAGLTAAITGSAGYGRDYILANEQSHDKILLVTVISVIVILLAIYRAPVAAIIPLAAIGIASAVSTKLAILGKGLGLSTGTAERLFMLVLLYGAGVDYSLLFITRYREHLEALPSPAAFQAGLQASLGTILASAATTAAGLAVLSLGRFGLFRDVGPAIVLALVVAAIASVTLVPAMVAIVGPRMFWPTRPRQKKPLAAPEGANAATAVGLLGTLRTWHERTWPSIASFVTRRPALVLGLTLAALALPAARGLKLNWTYDAQASLRSNYDAVRGLATIQRHWSIGEISPVTVLAVAPSPQGTATWTAACDKVLARLRTLDALSNVHAVTAPLGWQVDSVTNAAARLLGGQEVLAEFLSSNGQAMRLLATLRHPPQTLEAMADADRVRSAVREALTQAGLGAEVHLAGPTAETMDLRWVTRTDFDRLAPLTLAVILVIVVVLLRDLWLSLFMVAATVLGYLATLGLTYWTVRLLGQAGLDWEVEVFLFIVLIAVGQDYNLFFAVRVAQEGATLGPTQATEQALIHTGRVISSCGLIMAATLGSMVVGDIKMLQQLGFALALGMLIDTFIIRPLLLPSFIILTRRTLRKAMAFFGAAPQASAPPAPAPRPAPENGRSRS